MKPGTNGRWVLRLLALVLFTSMLGCATAPSTAKTLLPEDLKTLAGKWQGTGQLPAARAVQIEFTFNADGTYVALFGANSSRGVLRIVDGALTGERTDITGGGVGSSIWTATLKERDGRRTLIGNGRASAGPYSFEVTEQK